MFLKTLAVLCLLFFVRNSDALNDVQEESAEHAYLEFQDKILTAAMKIESSPTLQKELEERIQLVEAAENSFVPIEYHCDPSKFSPSDENPTSVHQVRPADVKVVAAFGDSITACNGCGARNMLELAFERRGEAWTAGSDRNMHDGWVTIPNLMSEFGGSPAGYSTCWSLQYLPNAWFNVAQPGGRNVHMPNQANNLVTMMQEDTTINFEEDWKVFTLFIGGNDLCGYCNNPVSNSPQNYRTNIENTVDIIMNNIPRSIFNIVTMFDLTPVGNLSTSTICDIMQMGWCECALNKTEIPRLKEVVHEYYLEMEELVNLPKYKGRSDFTVIHQTHMRDVKPWFDEETGEWDSSYLSVDCFHPNRLGHRGMAYQLWNAMLWPVGQKPTSQDMTVQQFDICCPSEEYPYIFTYENSINVPHNPWTPGQICWEPAGAAKTPHKIVAPAPVDEEKFEDKLARLGPPVPISHGKRVRRSPKAEASSNLVLYSLLGTGFLIAIIVGIVVARRKP